MTINPNIEVKESPIEGKGLFTKVDIKKGEHIWISKGAEPVEEKIYTPEEFKVFQQWCIENGKKWDAVSLPDGMVRAAVADRDNHPENYGNHSCEPNLSRDLIALRDIKAGEELTCDYTQFSDKNWSMKCHCSAKQCAGIVYGVV